jgi:hypothetical protein
VAWLGVVAALLPASDGFGVVVDRLGDPTRSASLFGLWYVLFGPVVVVGLPVALLVRDRFVSPLLATAVEVVAFLRAPGGGDAVGSAASLLWPAGLVLVGVLAGTELLARRVSRRLRRRRRRRRESNERDG